LENILSAAQVLTFADRLEELAALEGESAGQEFEQEAGTMRLSNLVDKDPLFEICFTHPRVLAAVKHVLNSDLKLSSLNCRFALPGEGHQGLHVDWGQAILDGTFKVCNSIWLLDDFTPDNGATRLVPGSHNSGKMPADVMADVSDAHPDQIQALGKAGSVVIFNSHTWHGGLKNNSDKPRRALHSYFCQRDVPQQQDQRKYLSPETLTRLSPQARIILDVGD